MNYLYHILAEKTDEWRQAGYPCEAYPAIAEILRYQVCPRRAAQRNRHQPSASAGIDPRGRQARSAVTRRGCSDDFSTRRIADVPCDFCSIGFALSARRHCARELWRAGRSNDPAVKTDRRGHRRLPRVCITVTRSWARGHREGQALVAAPNRACLLACRMMIPSNNNYPAEGQRNSPRTEYLRRLQALKTTQARCERQHQWLGVSKLVLGGVTLIVIGLALAAKVISVFWVAAPLAAIVVLAVIHERVLKRRERCSRTVAYYERALARLENRWAGAGETGERFENAAHPYSRDLDLFGTGSLFELLCTARTQAGQETLANWLMAARLARTGPWPPRRH